MTPETVRIAAFLFLLVPVWDRLFGTYVRPTPDHLAVQGLPYGRHRDLDLRYIATVPFQPKPAPDTLSHAEKSNEPLPDHARIS